MSQQFDTFLQSYQRNASGAAADVQARTYTVQPSNATQFLPEGQWLPAADIVNLCVPSALGLPILGGFPGPRIFTIDGGFFVESRLPIVSLSGAPLTLLYRAQPVYQGAVGLFYQLAVTGFPQAFGWEFEGQWQVIVTTGGGVIQSMRTFLGPISGLSWVLGNAGEIATIVGIAKF